MKEDEKVNIEKRERLMTLRSTKKRDEKIRKIDDVISDLNTQKECSICTRDENEFGLPLSLTKRCKNDQCPLFCDDCFDKIVPTKYGSIGPNGEPRKTNKLCPTCRADITNGTHLLDGGKRRSRRKIKQVSKKRSKRRSKRRRSKRRSKKRSNQLRRHL